MRRIVVTGPECSGKSVLSAALARHYGVHWVPEMARPFLEQLDRPYAEADLRTIAELQLRAEEACRLQQPGASVLICDTDLVTIRIWGEEKFGRSDRWVVQHTEQRHYDLWLLCAPDIPWVYDPQRENPFDRDRLFEVYKDLLERSGKPFVRIHGESPQRLQLAVEAIGNLPEPTASQRFWGDY